MRQTEQKLFRGSTAKAIVEVLSLLGVDRVFGLPGIQNTELFDELADAPFDTVTPTNESSAAFMADAHARVTGRLGVVILTAGPGLTNALTGVAEALLDSSPILIILASASRHVGKAFPLHQIPQDALVRPLTKGIFQPCRPSDVPKAIFQAAALAVKGEPGPAVVEIPSDLLMEQCNCSISSPVETAVSEDIEAKLDEAATILRRSSSIGIYAGAGAMSSSTELIKLAEILQAPVATTISGRGVIPEDHPLSVGYGFGRSGTAVARRLFRNVRTLLAIGCKYGEVATGSYGVRPPPEHIHVDINPSSVNANYPASLPIVADAKQAILGITARLGGRDAPRNESLLRIIQRTRRRFESTLLCPPKSTLTVGPQRFLHALRNRLDRDAILVTDCGSHQLWALSDFPVYLPRTFLTPADFQAMGFSIPSAISAKLAFPGRQVVSLVGDGGFLMSGFECLNAVRLDARITVVVFRDGAWGLVKDAQQRIHRRAPFTELPTPDLQSLAKGFGMEYVAIESDDAIGTGLTDAMACRGACLLDVKVGYETSPPYVKGTAQQMFGNLSLTMRARLAARYAKRILFPVENKNT